MLTCICEQLQLKQVDGAPPLSADIQSNPIRVYVSSATTRDLTVPASGIVTLTVPVDAASNSIWMTVVTVIHLFCGLN